MSPALEGCPATGAPGRIYVLDQAEPHPDWLEAYRSAVLHDYRPAALARGMALEAAWLAPPLVLAGGGNVVVFLWSFADLKAFWRARFADTEDKLSWWSGTAHMVRERKRMVLTDLPGV